MDHIVLTWLLLLCAFIGQTLSCFCDHYPWTSWSSCSKTCNYGTQSRQRQIRVDDYYRKNLCDQLCEKESRRSCNEQACPINCALGDYGAWSSCDPCVKKQFRTRSLLSPSQFGGQSCTEQMVDSRRCTPSKLCNIEELNCRNKFMCDTGRCIPNALECNGENDCGDNSDERDCRRKKPLCARRYESIPSVQLLGNGFNILAGESRGEVLDTTFTGGKCRTVKSNDTRKTFRIPGNVENINFQVENDEDEVESDFFNDLINLNDATSYQGSHSGSGRSSSGIPLLFSRKTRTKTTSTSSFKEAVQASYKKNSNFIRIHKVISVSNFTLKKGDLWISDVFLKSLHHLPLEYNYALYSRIFDNFGTHYFTSGSMGGTYDLLYQYSTEELKTSGLTEQESKECVRTETTRRVFFRKKKTVRERCVTNKMSERSDGSFLQSSEKSISLVKGGRSEYAAALAWKRQGTFPDHNIFQEWLESTKDNPVVVGFELAPILDLVKGFPCDVTKRRNLQTAIMEYSERFDPCKCSPCPNNGRPVLSGTECLCVCQSGTYGTNCERRAPDYKTVAVDGYWSCWSAWSPCDASFKRKRTRECNNPSPLNGGKACQGENKQEQDCHFSIFMDSGALCITDDEERKEIDDLDPEPTTGCTKPTSPENGFFRVEKKLYAAGEEVEVVCYSGYELVGYQFFRCLPDGRWHEQGAECKVVACSRPAVAGSVSISPYQIDYKIGESIQIICPPGFKVIGQKGYTCANDLSWRPPINRELTCEKEQVTDSNCRPGQKQDGSQCVCMSPEKDCGAYSEEVCVFDAGSVNYFTRSSCEYLAEKCLEKNLHFLRVGPCGDVNLVWAVDRAALSTRSTKKEPCGYDFCYDWEKCSGTQCFCLLPYQCPKDENLISCVKVGASGRQMSANYCMFGAMKCSNIKADLLHSGKCSS
ncbi:complement component C6-like [Ambystoma mexicanum]|uniref:complement component C6-like n=1 Tax=Ambystoma mexicanum TaxID=8296 RepID=UPI0037E96329